MWHGDAHFGRGASSRLCNMVDDPMRRARGEAAEAEVDHLMNHALSSGGVGRVTVDHFVEF